MVCDWLIRGSHDFFGEISGDFHYIFTTCWVFSRHLFTTFSLHFTTISPQIFTTKDFHYIFSLHFHYKFSLQRDEQTGTNRLHGDTQTDLDLAFSRHFHYIFTTILSRAANLHIFTTFSLHFHDNLITGC